MSREQPPAASREIDWAKVMEIALTAEGNLGSVYSRFYNYSFLNQIYLVMQRVQEPIATYKKWQAIGRQVMKGSKAKEIIRPLIIAVENEQGEKEERLTGFKGVRCIFGLSETTGKELPQVAIPEWDLETALKKLCITQVPFDVLNGNIQGFSTGLEFSVNPIAEYPIKTTFHEIGHIVLGHTMPNAHAEYATHKGIREFEAEATAHLAMNELQLMDETQASVSRGYIRHWLQDERPSDENIRRVFKVTDSILRAGRLAVSPPDEA